MKATVGWARKSAQYSRPNSRRPSGETSGAVHYNLGAALADKGRLDEAIACYRKAIEIAPKDARAHHNLAAALAGKGQLDEAIASYRKAIELNPKSAAAHS